jgi:predicted HTH domain antitoxin
MVRSTMPFTVKLQRHAPPKRLHCRLELAVLELYRRRQISSGKAAELIRIERMELVRFASRQGIAFYDLSEEEFADELDLLSEAL